MTLHLTLVSADRLPSGKPLRVEIRDTSVADAPAILVEAVDDAVPASAAREDVTLTISLDQVPDGSTVWVHVDADGDGRVSRGDFITMESYPVQPSGVQRTTIRLRKVT